jgi:hypothetical protein
MGEPKDRVKLPVAIFSVLHFWCTFYQAVPARPTSYLKADSYLTTKLLTPLIRVFRNLIG